MDFAMEQKNGFMKLKMHDGTKSGDQLAVDAGLMSNWLNWKVGERIKSVFRLIFFCFKMAQSWNKNSTSMSVPNSPDKYSHFQPKDF